MSVVDVSGPTTAAVDGSVVDGSVVDGPAGDRAALARAVLANAERRTGVRHAAAERDWVRTWAEPQAAPETVTSVPAVSVPAVSVPAVSGPAVSGSDLPVAAELRHLLPGGVLRRGRTVAVTGSRSLLLALLARASTEGAWAAVVGLPALGLVAATEAGIDLDRLALVPDPGLDAPLAVAALLDGMDVVVVGPRVALSGADRRRLQARTRERGAVLVTATTWPGAHVVLDAAPAGWSGASAGSGWLRRQRVAVERTGRAGCTPGTFEVELPLGSRSTASFRDAARGPTTQEQPPAVPPRPVSRPGRPDLRLVG